MGDFDWRQCYTSYVNLPHREDRNSHMLAELERVGLLATRTDGLSFDFCKEKYGEEKIKKMESRHKGAVGCHFSQVSVMEKALSFGKSAFILEDDVVFSNDVTKRLDHAQDFLNSTEWDIFWLGGTYCLNSPQWHNRNHTHPDLRDCKCNLDRDAEHTRDPRIMKTYGCWSTYAYIVNYKSLEKILHLLDENVENSYAIDWLFIKLQPWLNTFAFIPGMAKQIDGQSDIMNGIRKFSDFSYLGDHWFSDSL